ncbi:unnamed protein product, partial [marine sediment metagenome]
SAFEVMTCRDLWLKREMALMKPKVMLLFGNQCIRAMLGAECPSVTQIHGQVFERQFKGEAMKLVAPHQKV